MANRIWAENAISNGIEKSEINSYNLSKFSIKIGIESMFVCATAKIRSDFELLQWQLQEMTHELDYAFQQQTFLQVTFDLCEKTRSKNDTHTHNEWVSM